jgi:CheY-like chemotaxis protein
MVRDLLCEALAAAGFEVLAARHGQEALEMFDRDSPPLDLLVTDVVMPRMSGPDLAERLLERRPDLRVLFMSGYASDQLTPRVPLGSRVGFLQKPFSPSTLIQRVLGLLEARPVG